MKRLLMALLFVGLMFVYTLAYECDDSRYSALAPISVMGDHLHHKKEAMVSYRLMTMTMDQNQSARTKQSVSDVLSSYMVAPLEMTMRMHMLGVMFAPDDRFTLMMMLPYVTKSMSHRKRDLSEFTRQSQGLGDTRISALIGVMNREFSSMHLNVGLGLPTGSIDETDGQPVRLPYPMQLGSGSYDLHLGSTFNRSIRGSTLGGQLSTVLRLGKNKHGYALGNTYAVQGWYAYFLSDSLSVSLRSKLAGWGDIRGRDSDLNPAMVPSAETDRAGSQLDLGLGVAYSFVTGQFKGSRLGLELTGPVYQRFDSVQLASNWGVTLGWQYAR